MTSPEEKIDESKFKESYKKIIRQYLPLNWKEYEIDEFIEELLRGIIVPSIPDRYEPDFVKAIRQIREKWLFSTLSIRNDGRMIIGYKYFPNPKAKAVEHKNKTQGKKTLEEYKKL
jgi:hypothetical protein